MRKASDVLNAQRQRLVRFKKGRIIGIDGGAKMTDNSISLKKLIVYMGVSRYYGTPK